MNARLVVRLIGSVLAVEGLLMFLPLLVSLYYGGVDYPAILLSIAIVLAAGVLLGSVRAKSELLRPREGLAVVAAEPPGGLTLGDGARVRLSAVDFRGSGPASGMSRAARLGRMGRTPGGSGGRRGKARGRRWRFSLERRCALESWWS